MTMKIQELHWTSSANATQKHVKGKKGRENKNTKKIIKASIQKGIKYFQKVKMKVKG